MLEALGVVDGEMLALHVRHTTGRIHSPSNTTMIAEMDHRYQAEIAMLNHSLDPESQAKIEELIRLEARMENLQNALEHDPQD
ncbi:MAG: hypothetical protein M1826_002983 [Phylliscum demangeonii]|nr:MAG: hypothetical protein M1826_002983 [Phylliscum demangeonii]